MRTQTAAFQRWRAIFGSTYRKRSIQIVRPIKSPWIYRLIWACTKRVRVFLDSNPCMWLDDAVVQRNDPSGARGMGINGGTRRMGLREGGRLLVSRPGRNSFRPAGSTGERRTCAPSSPVRPPAPRAQLLRTPGDFSAGRDGVAYAPHAQCASPVQAATPRMRRMHTGLVSNVNRLRRQSAPTSMTSVQWAGAGCPWGARLSRPAIADLIGVGAAKRKRPVETRRGHK